MRRLAPLIVLALTAAGLTLAAQPASAAGPAAGSFVPVAQKRVVDTGVGMGVVKGALAGQHTVRATVAGVPTSASAVEGTLTVTSPTVSGGLTLFRPGSTRPATTNLIFAAKQPASNTTVALVSNGQFEIFNAAPSGSVQVIFDITGYFVGGVVTGAPGLFHPSSPARVINTASKLGATGPVGAGKPISVVLAASGHPLPVNTYAAAVNITVTAPTRAGSITAYGSTRPAEPTLDYAAGGRVSTYAVVPLSSTGALALFNNSTGTVQITVDLLGYYFSGAPTTSAGTLQPLPVTSLGAHQLAANSTTSVKINQLDGVPVSSSLVSAVLIGFEAKAPAAAGYLTAYPGTTAPLVRQLTWAAHGSAENQVLLPLAADGTVKLHNASAGTTPLSIYVYGYVGATTLAVPAASPSRYVRNVSDTDITAMNAEGTADANAGAKLVILEFGAQKSDMTGVQLTGPAGTPLSYANVQAAVQSYLSGFGAHPGVTIGVGTNNDGPGPNNTGWTIFPPTDRGARWAQLVDAITPPDGVTVVGADDIESEFWSTEPQAEAWEAGYIGATTKTLIFNGAASGCPVLFGQTGGNCPTIPAPTGWTERTYYNLAHSGTRIQAVPQIYNAAQAVQWANIDATGINAGTGPITFAGVLTEHATDSSTFTAQQGWAAAYHALSAVVASPSLPALTDIQVNG